MKKIIVFILRRVFQLLFRVRINGSVDCLDAKKLLIIANHESFLDGVLLGLFLPFDPVFVVHTSVTKRFFFRFVLAMTDYLAVDTSSPMSIKKVVKLVESGRPVVIFPEGRITVTGSLMKVYEGPAFVAAKTNATVLPVRLDGAARSYFSRLAGRIPRSLFPRITLSIQKSAVIPLPEDSSPKARRRKAGDAMRRLMQKMLFESRPKLTLYSGFLDAMEVHGRKYNIAEDVKSPEYTYGDLLKMTLALGRVVEKNSGVGECVGILMPNVVATLCMTIGTGACGRSPAMINYKAGGQGIQDACTAAKISTIISSRAFIEEAKLKDDISSLEGVRILYLEEVRNCLGFFDKLRIFFGMLFPRAVERERDPESTAAVLFTSGSEGKPKGVALSHRALLSNIAQIRAVIDFSEEDKMLNALPFFHSFGLTAGGLLSVMTGTKLFLYPSPLHYRVIPEIVYDRNCSVMFGTSTFLANYAKFAHPYDFYRLRYVVAGAEKLADSVRDLWFEKFGIRVLEGYGATETAPVLALNTPMAYRKGTVGQLLPGIEGRLLPVPGIEKGGMLHVRGPNLMSGYYRHETPGKLLPPNSELGEGWYETGDVVDIDEEGFLSIVGRVKRFAKVAGEMISLDIVEKLAAHATAVGMHAASTKTDSARGESIVLFTTDAGLKREALNQSAKILLLPEIALPRKLVCVNSLPLLQTGKVDYVSLKQMAEAA
ncbi:MAG: bifunctional acyl-ACP--phospholipid O-acyltransferase/long-chain-fatty-acid--ACP ligase [Candidatus Accumulibacter sp.]|jgi:acyl-[acyl-carrier-protein]-phospholipid O-acyltransferase/long-chain-fatty-acid--[acyl-carrier-protein] ligase|nr:bifunctional acyl-ACP--phospholipid O-acyltransferase/long-chain-fatty-acid--ACP ligase [Accumulibacter sp.]